MRILVGCDLQRSHDRERLRGIRARFDARRDVRLRICLPTELRGCYLREKPDGVILHYPSRGRVWTPAVPHVFQSGGGFVSGVAVTPDNVAIGRMAAAHLLDVGLSRFAVVGARHRRFSVERMQGFSERMREAGHEELVHTVTLKAVRAGAWGFDRFFHELGEPTTPCGVFCVTDEIARWLMEAALGAGVAVPDMLAVVGVNNDLQHGVLAPRSLTTVDPDYYAIGVEAASLLEALLAGRPVDPHPRCVPPRTLIARESSNTVGTQDVEVREAFRWIQSHACDGIRVPEVAEHLHISRRTLEIRFKAALGRTVAEEIRRVRLEAARAMLRMSDRKIAAVACACGFSSLQQFVTVFRIAFDETPGVYRKRGNVVGRDAAPDS